MSEALHPRAPMITLALALSGGILAGNYCWRPPLWIAIAATAFATSAAVLVSRRARWAWVVAHLAAATLGWTALAGQLQLNAATTPNLSDFFLGQEVTLTARVTHESRLRKADFVQVDVETESLADETHAQEVKSGVRLNLYPRWEEYGNTEEGDRSGAMFSPHYGDVIRVKAKLREPKNFRNPGALDYAGYLRRQGIYALGAGKIESVQVIGSRFDRLNAWRNKAQRSVVARIHQLWPERQAALMDAMLLGDRSLLDADLSKHFQRSGTYHVLVVSGMNVGILALVVFWILRRIKIAEAFASAVTVIVAVGYALLCDGGAPIVRATLMLAIFLIASLLYRRRTHSNAVGVAAGFVLLFDPLALFDTSFQLTFLCVLVIAGLALPILERTSEPWRRGMLNFQSTGFDLALPPRVVQFRLDLRLIAARFGKLGPEALARFVMLRITGLGIAAWEVLLVSFLMQLALVLPMAIYFHRATLMALPANMLVVPLTEVLMPTSAAAVSLSYISQELATVPAQIAGWSLDLITGTVRIAGSMRVADLRLPTPSILISAMVVLALIAALVSVRRSRRLALTSLSLLIAAAVLLVIRPAQPSIRPNTLEVTGIDVGQADSTLLVSPKGRTMLVDAAGPLGFSRSEFDFGENVVSPYLWARGIKKLDVVVITHGHSDHIGGMPSVINNFHPQELWVGPLPDLPSINAVLDRARKLGVAVRELRAGDEFEWGGSRVRVLSPPRDWHAADKVRNNDSLALQIRYGETAVLLEGDAEKQMEKAIASERPQSALLKIAHNGSLTSTTPELLDSVKPNYALISVGTPNSFRHPRPEILARLAERQIRTFRTDTMGAITFVLDGTRVQPILAAERRR